MSYGMICKLQKAMLYTVFATVGVVLLIGLITGSGLYDFRALHPGFLDAVQYLAGILLLVAGIPLLGLSLYRLVVGDPARTYVLENPFPSAEALHGYFKGRLENGDYQEPKEVVGNQDLTLTFWAKEDRTQTRIIGVAAMPKMTDQSWNQMAEGVSAYLQSGHIPGREKFLTLLICVEEPWTIQPENLADRGTPFCENELRIGFLFNDKTMTFIGKNEGLAAGKPKRMLRGFLYLLPDAPRYLELQALEKGVIRTRDQVIWPFNPQKVPTRMHLIWGLSSFLLSIMGLVVGGVLIHMGEKAFGVAVFGFAGLMIVGGVYQLQKVR